MNLNPHGSESPSKGGGGCQFNDFRELTVPVTLKKGTNRIGFTAEELPDFDGATYNQYDQ